jgi:hypothetical protein
MDADHQEGWCVRRLVREFPDGCMRRRDFIKAIASSEDRVWPSATWAVTSLVLVESMALSLSDP